MDDHLQAKHAKEGGVEAGNLIPGSSQPASTPLRRLIPASGSSSLEQARASQFSNSIHPHHPQQTDLCNFHLNSVRPPSSRRQKVPFCSEALPDTVLPRRTRRAVRSRPHEAVQQSLQRRERRNRREAPWPELRLSSSSNPTHRSLPFHPPRTLSLSPINDLAADHVHNDRGFVDPPLPGQPAP